MNKVKIIKFTTSWCPQCKVVSKMLEVFSKDHPEIEVEDVNADDCNPELLEKYLIRSVPTLVIQNIETVDYIKVVGVISEEDLLDKCQRFD